MTHYPVPAGWTLRPSQREAITKIKDAFDRGKSIVVLQAPTGSGKSLIGRTMTNYYGSAYLLTPIISLQEQYEKDFSPEVKLFKGKAHYPCAMSWDGEDEDFPTVEDAWCQGSSSEAKKQVKECRDVSRCYYYNARDAAAEAHCALMNFKGFTVWMELGAEMDEPIFTRRGLHVIDEAHKIEDNIRNHLEFKIKSDYVKLFARDLLPSFPNEYTNEQGVRMYVERLQDHVFDTILYRYNDHHGSQRPASNSNEDRMDFVCRVYAEIQEDSEMSKDLRQHVSYYRKMELYLGRDDYAAGAKNGELLVQPTNVSWFIREFILGDHTLMMSATIPKNIIMSLGFEEDEVEYIEMDSTFPKANRPIFLTPVANMNGTVRKSPEEKARVVTDACNMIVRILEKFENDKGIIHVNSFETAKLIKAEMGLINPITLSRFIFHGPGEMDKALETHKKGNATILVTPSMKEGVDLKDDLSRVQIIYKCPWLSLDSPATKVLSRDNPKWYKAQTLANFMQMYGRSIRTETDTAKTYILDQALIEFLKQNFNYIPRYITEAIHWR